MLAADVDGDGDLDALSASLYDDKIAWHENKRFNTTGVQSEDAPDPIIPPLPIPPPPSPIGQTRLFGDVNVGDSSAPPLPNGRGSEMISPFASAFDDYVFDADVRAQRVVRLAAVERPGSMESVDVLPDNFRLLDDVFAAGVDHPKQNL